jgi:hypothetical protein
MSQNSKPKKAFASQTGWFSFLYPSDWEVEEDQFVTAYNPEGVGALHMSAYEAPYRVDPGAELLDHLSQDNPLTRLENIRTSAQGNKTVASFETLDEQSFQKVWFVAHESCLVIATYNSDADDWEVEIAEVEGVVQSIEIRPNL